jgi:predicted RNase H-like HicB family nuclease
MTTDEYLAIPYILTLESVARTDGEWVRRASYPELPGCVVEAFSPVEAIERLDEIRRDCILGLIERGEPVPVPRPPLRSARDATTPERLGFGRWLVDQGRVSDT